jgi:hypothetical protein
MPETKVHVEVELWERQPGGSGKAFAGFLIYLNLGPARSINEASRIHHEHADQARQAEQAELGVKVPPKRASGCVKQWAKKFQWATRAAAYDTDQARLLRQKQLAEIREMNDRQTNTGLLMQQGNLIKLNSIDGESLSVREAVDMLIKGATLERLARGEPTEITEQPGMQPITHIEIGSNDREDEPDAGSADTEES